MAKGRFSVVRVNEEEEEKDGGSGMSLPLKKKDSGYDSADAESCAEPDSSDLFSQFIYKRTLGSGGYGKVYLASLGSGGQNYAVKVAPKRIGKPTDEYMVLSKVKHPFIVSLRYHFIGGHNEYFALDYCGGGDLGTLLSRKTFLYESQTAFYCSEILSALDYLHVTLHIAYRDLKPSNVLIDSTGHVKLTDFGLSIPLSRTPKKIKLCGTTEYMSPELFVCDSIPDPVKNDLWAFGCLLYELLVGETPFEAGAKSKTIDNIIHIRYDADKRGSLSPASRNLLKDIFVYEKDRISGVRELINYDFFDGLNFMDPLSLRETTPPFDPMLRSEDDFTHFEKSSLEDDKGFLKF